MDNLISVFLPLNIDQSEFYLYKPYINYKFPIQKIKRLKNVFVTFSGLCMNRKGLIKECHHDYPQQYEYYLNESSRHYYDVSDNPANLITLNNDTTYLAIHHPWFNYYHWICESIFRLWIVRRRLHCLTLVLPEYYKNTGFIQASLKPFDLKNIYYIPNGKSLLVKNLCLPQIKPVCDSYNSLHLKQVRSFYYEQIKNTRMPDGVINTIEAKYPGAQFTKDVETIDNSDSRNDVYKACFVYNGKRGYALIDANGKIIRSRK